MEGISNVPAKRVSPKDVFLHLMAMVALYFSVGTFLTLIFQLTNYFLPDSLSPEYMYGGVRPYLELMRFAIATLIVTFPILIVVSRFLAKTYVTEPAKKESKVRKWLLYLTLFIAALFMGGDLIKIIYNFLEGEITLRFIVKALSLLIVFAVVFVYYLWELKQQMNNSKVKYFVWGVSIVMATMLVVGFLVAGSPSEARSYRFDEQRVMDLGNLQWQIINYWQGKVVLPGTLISLEDSVSGFKVPVDPENGQAYEYNVKGPETFELCAVFNRPSIANTGNYSVPMPVGGNWEHAEGRVCFERKIDKDLYPPLKK